MKNSDASPAINSTNATKAIGRDRASVSDIRAIYGRSAALDLEFRNPVVFIPGILGSRLVGETAEGAVWGDFGRSYADAKDAQTRRLIALPMSTGLTLDKLLSPSLADGTVRQANLRHLPIKVNAYRDILNSVGVGMRTTALDKQPGYAGGGMFRSFEFGYDWRRSLDETARELDDYLRLASHVVQALKGSSEPVKFDVVAHSMGGLVLRYYLRYGRQLLPTDGSLPRLTWAGCERVQKAIIIGTPNGGSVMALDRLVGGLAAKRLVHPGYDTAIIGTMPALYQLLPRSRSSPFIAPSGKGDVNIFDTDHWLMMQWGLADPKIDELLAIQLPGIASSQERREVAVDHLRKCLQSAKTLHQSLDLPAQPPTGVEGHLIAGDAIPTCAAVTGEIGAGKVEAVRFEAGDGTVLRSSALLDERTDQDWQPRVNTPIDWKSVIFASSNHMSLTQDRVVVNNVLYRLLEAQ